MTQAYQARMAAKPKEDMIEEAREVLWKCLRGQVAPSTGEVQRRTAVAILAGDLLTSLSDEDLLAEVRRRAAAREKPKETTP